MESPRKCTCDAIAIAAVQSLDNLGEQIAQFVNTNSLACLPANHGGGLGESVDLMQRLLVEAQSRFKAMVDDNKKLANHIDGSLGHANQDMQNLRDELAYTNERLNEITIKAMEGKIPEDANLNTYNNDEKEIMRLKQENAKLEAKVRALQRDIEELRNVKAKAFDGGTDCKMEMIQSQQELSRAKDALQKIRQDRKKLQAEKLELLDQIKQLYSTLEDKENELRQFIRNYEQRVKESEDSIKQMTAEKKECERDKWEIMKRARDATERSLQLKTQLDMKDQYIETLKSQVNELKEKLGKTDKSDNFALVNSPMVNKSGSVPMSLDTPPSSGDRPRSTLVESSFAFTSTSTPKDDITQNFSALSTMLTTQSLSDDDKKRRKKGTSLGMNSLSRVFSRSKVRKSVISAEFKSTEAEPSDRQTTDSITILNVDNCQEKLDLVEKCKSLPMSRWKANHVLAWIEVAMSLSAYGKMCAENVKSGKVLLGLSDNELEIALGISNPMHRRKLRLAIEEKKDPSHCVKYVKAGALDHTWIATHWLQHIGLTQFTTKFESELIDGRMLNGLTRKDMEKHLGIIRKFHQCSIQHGVELLRRVNFDKEAVAERRLQCENSDCDPLVWTNQRVVQWVKSIDLHEYSDNLKDSGVHGALIVLESSFDSVAMATALGIPQSKAYVRRHLQTELDQIIKPAREKLQAALTRQPKPKAASQPQPTMMAMSANENGSSSTGSMGRSFDRSFRGSPLRDDAEATKKRASLKGSLGRAFGRKPKGDFNQCPPDATATTTAPSPRKTNPQHSSMREKSPRPKSMINGSPSTSCLSKDVSANTLSLSKDSVNISSISKNLTEGTTV